MYIKLLIEVIVGRGVGKYVWVCACVYECVCVFYRWYER